MGEPRAPSLRTRALRALLATLGVACLLPPAAAQPDVSYRTIALSAQPAPGQPAGVTLDAVGSVRLNEAGDSIFWARLAGPGATDPKRASLWTDRDGTPTLLLAQGDAAPGGLLFTALAEPRLAPNSEAFYLAAYAGPAPPPPGVAPAPTLAILAQPGMAYVDLGAADGALAPSPSPDIQINFSHIATFETGASGHMAFVANTSSGIWGLDPGGSLALRALAGTPVESALQVTSLAPPALDAAGRLAVRAMIDADTTDTSQHSAILSWAVNSAPVVLARTGASAPGLPEGTTFAELGADPATAGADGLTAFWARVAGDQVGPGSDTGVWTATPVGGAALLVRAGDPAPGAPGATFASFSRRPVLGAPHHLAVLAIITGEAVTAADNAGIWVFTPGGSPRLVVRENQQVPGLGPGTVLGSLGEPVVNARGQVAFLARLRGPDVTPATSRALLATDTCGGLHVVARTGTAFALPGEGGPPRVIASISLAPVGGIGGGIFSSAGALAYHLEFRATATTFTDGLFAAIPHHAADVNADGAIATADISGFLVAWFADLAGGTLITDFDLSGAVTSADVSAFLSAWFSGIIQCQGS